MEPIQGSDLHQVSLFLLWGNHFPYPSIPVSNQRRGEMRWARRQPSPMQRARERAEGKVGPSPSCIPSVPGRRPDKVSETCCPPFKDCLVALKHDAVITSELTPSGLQGGSVQ